MVSVFDDILEILKDGHYHKFEDILAKTKNLNENQLEFILSFLQEYNFIKRQRKTWSTRTRQAKLNPVLENFLKRLIELESRERIREKYEESGVERRPQSQQKEETPQ
jgi:hypothetical protein